MFKYVQLTLGFILLSALGVHAVPSVDVKVTDEILRAADDYQPLGVNSFGDAGGIRQSAGNLIFNPGFEPATMRNLYRVLACGKENGKYWVQLDGPGASNHLLFTTGTYSGAAMRAYRFVDKQGKALPFKKATWTDYDKLLDASAGHHVLPLFKGHVLTKGTPGFPDGGWLADAKSDTYAGWAKLSKDEKNELKKTWRVFYDADVKLRMDDVVIFEQTMIWPDCELFHVRTRGKEQIDFAWSVTRGSARQIDAPTDTPDEMEAGKGVLLATPDDGGVVELWNKQFGATGRPDAFYYGMLDEGNTYRFEAWAKVQDTDTGRLIFGFGENRHDAIEQGYFGHKLEDAFKLDNTWQRVGYTFKAPSTPTQGGIYGAVLRYVGKGALLLDNVKLFPIEDESDIDKPFVIYKPLFDEMVNSQPTSGRKGACRFWAGLTEGRMEALCDWMPDNVILLGSSVRMRPHHLTTIPKALTILEATGDSAQTRMVPWIILQVMHDEDEHRQLVEYLAASYDPAVDTPQSKPMAYKRVKQRGHNRPWTEDFREIIIEMGNENWHNRAHTGWIGMGRYGHINGGGAEYGLWNKYMAGEMAKSPYWDQDKITICIGGSYYTYIDGKGIPHGYGYDSTIKADGAGDYHTHATYIGPRWETGEKSQSSIDDEGVQRTLYSYRPAIEREWSRHVKSQKRLLELGFKTQITAYEGGPSGFGYRAKSRAEEEAGEYYGKSSAMGTAIFDAWIDAWEKGWTYQCYLEYGQGKWWRSHTSIPMGFRPSPGFLAQAMINKTIANYDLLKVEVSGGTKLDLTHILNKRDRDEKAMVQTLAAHASGSSDYVAVGLANLSLQDDQHVNITTPLSSVSQVTLYYLTGDPRDTNLQKLSVQLKSKALDSANYQNGRFTYTVKAGSAVSIVFQK